MRTPLQARKPLRFKFRHRVFAGVRIPPIVNAWRSFLIGNCPEPRLPFWCLRVEHYPTDNLAANQHNEIILAPVGGAVMARGCFENELLLGGLIHSSAVF